MNELVIFNSSFIRAINISFKYYELAVCERAKVHCTNSLAKGQWHGFKWSCDPLSNFMLLIHLIWKPVRLPAFLALQRYLVGCSRTINPSTEYLPLNPPHRNTPLQLFRLSVGGSKILPSISHQAQHRNPPCRDRVVSSMKTMNLKNYLLLAPRGKLASSQ